MSKVQAFLIGAFFGLVGYAVITWVAVSPPHLTVKQETHNPPLVVANCLAIPAENFIQLSPLADGRLMVEFHTGDPDCILRYYYVWEHGKVVLMEDK